MREGRWGSFIQVYIQIVDKDNYWIYVNYLSSQLGQRENSTQTKETASLAVFFFRRLIGPFELMTLGLLRPIFAPPLLLLLLLSPILLHCLFYLIDFVLLLVLVPVFFI